VSGVGPPRATTLQEDRPRVRHVRTGNVGELREITRHDWALVAWDAGGPGMVGKDGLSYIAPGLLLDVRTGRRVGP
jgi:hypothetical protein